MTKQNQGKRTKVAIVGADLIPFNEAYANQVRVLSEKLDARVLTCRDLRFVPVKKRGRYLIVNVGFLTRKTPILCLLNGLFLYLVLKSYESRFDVILLSAGVESMFLKFLNLKKCVPIISTIDDEEKAKQFASKIAPNLKKVVVQSSRVKQKLIELGVDPNKLHLIYPIVDLDRFKYTEPPPLSPFRILFASAPNVEIPEEDNFLVKGVPLLLEAFKKFTEVETAELYLLWRGKYSKELNQKIEELRLRNKVVVVDKEVDAAEWYKETHVTVIPFLSTWRSPQVPLSALESLVSGRPVVTTNVLELADIVEKYRCGCVSSPTKDGLLSALMECKQRYSEFQRNSRKIAWILYNRSKSDIKALIHALEE